ncbi:hypothetical protein MMC26_006953 [Xylographa opegraphella]|nr:hypothetical protein [Xylographa opegraphella]
MPVSISSSNSSLTRYRPAILVLTALAAGYTIYYVHSNFYSSKSSSSHPLVRRNAVHRSSQRRRDRLRSSDARDTRRVVSSYEALEEFHSYEIDERYRSVVDNTTITVPLRHGLQSPEEIATQFSLSLEDATRVREKVQEMLLIAAFSAIIPHNAILADPGGRQAYVDVFAQEGFSRFAVIGAVERFNSRDFIHPHPLPGEDSVLLGPLRPVELLHNTTDDSQAQYRIPRMDGEDDDLPQIQALDVSETVVEEDSENSWRGGDETDESKKEGQSLLNLLYHIAEDQARREGYVHRGVSCNSCNTQPIRGIRYRCSNCADFDLCETCEAAQVHPKTHVFYKVRVPAPFTGSPRNVQPVWYPGRPVGLPPALPREASKHFQKTTSLEGAEIEALWDQFKCLAATDWPEDPDNLGVAINRLTFDKCFTSSISSRRPPPNLIYDRMFAFYDTNSDGLIGFGEFLGGLVNLKSRNLRERTRKVFHGYDIDGDGFVSRRDLLRMFRAYYALTKELTREIIGGMEEDVTGDGAQRDIVESSLPISSAFPGPIPPGESSHWDGKSRDRNGDFVPDREDILNEQEADEGDYHEVIADVMERQVFGDIRGEPLDSETSDIDLLDERIFSDEAFHEMFPDHEGSPGDVARSPPDHPQESMSSTEGPEDNNTSAEETRHTSDYAFPDDYVLPEDVESALGTATAFEDVGDPRERSAVRRVTKRRLSKEYREDRLSIRQKSVQERWERRQFYLVEEDGFPVPNTADNKADLHSTDIPAPIDPVKARIDGIKCIRDSSSLKPFKATIKDGMKLRGWQTGDEAETTALADLLVNMAGLNYEAQVMTSNLQHLRHCPDADSFINWFVERISNTEKEIRNRPSTTTNGYASNSQRRSRSSSKVRFQDDLTDTELETRSNTSMSSRSIPLGERWGGFEVPEPEKDLGREYLYQVTQESLNELLDPIFRQREDLAMEVARSAELRSLLRHILNQWLTPKKKKLVEIQFSRWQKMWRTLEGHDLLTYKKSSSEGQALLLHMAMQHRRGSPSYRNNVEDLWAAGMQSTLGESEEALDRAIEKFMREVQTGGSDFQQGAGSAGLLLSSDFITTPRSSPDDTSERVEPALPQHQYLSDSELNTKSPAGRLDNDIIDDDFSLAGTPGVDAELFNEMTADTQTGTEYPAPALELHSAVTTFNEADPSLEQAILQKPLAELLHSAGYHLCSPDESNPSHEYIDPTLPQNRPSTTDSGTPPTTSPRRFDPTRPPGPCNRIPDYTDYFVRLPLDEPPVVPLHFIVCVNHPAMEDKLKFLAMMDCIEQEDRDRGGAGRISLPEFEEILEGPRGATLQFVGAWLHTATFWGSAL